MTSILSLDLDLKVSMNVKCLLLLSRMSKFVNYLSILWGYVIHSNIANFPFWYVIRVNRGIRETALMQRFCIFCNLISFWNQHCISVAYAQYDWT